jgi:hypothetical protein
MALVGREVNPDGLPPPGGRPGRFANAVSIPELRLRLPAPSLRSRSSFNSLNGVGRSA